MALTAGTITLRRPRVRNLEQRFESQVLPLFKRRSNELGAMLPQLYLHGLASGDFELALRGLLGEGAPLSAASLMRLKGTWQAECAAWKRADLSQLELVYCRADGVVCEGWYLRSQKRRCWSSWGHASGEKMLLACEAGEGETRTGVTMQYRRPPALPGIVWFRRA